jgi:hypothetical protein
MKNLKILLIMMISITSGIIAQESYKLEYNFSKGKDYKYRMTNDGIVTQTVMGQEMKININGEIYVKLESEGTNADSSYLLVSLDSAKYRVNMPMRDTTTTLENMVGKRMRLTVLKNGKVINRETIDTVMGNADMLSQVSGETTRLIILPEKEIKVGETWNNENVDSVKMMGGSIKTKSNVDYTLLGRSDTLGHSCLRIEFQGKTSSEGKAKVMGMDLFIEGNGKISGIFLFDPGKGLMINSNSHSDNEMTMAATGEQNMIIPISQSSNEIRTLIEN